MLYFWKVHASRQFSCKKILEIAILSQINTNRINKQKLKNVCMHNLVPKSESRLHCIGTLQLASFGIFTKEEAERVVVGFHQSFKTVNELIRSPFCRLLWKNIPTAPMTETTPHIGGFGNFLECPIVWHGLCETFAQNVLTISVYFFPWP